MKNIIAFIILSLCFACEISNQEASKPVEEELVSSIFQTGDIIFQTSKSNQSKAIQLATNSKYSHVGIIVIKENNLYVLEAVQPVKMTPLKEWIKRGENNHFVLKRLDENRGILTEAKLQKAIKIGKKMLGKNYDSAFEWSDDKIYCSELVWKIYKKALNVKLCDLKKLEDFNLDNDIVKAKLKERYGNNIPMKEKVVSPQDIFDSKELVEVFL